MTVRMKLLPEVEEPRYVFMHSDLSKQNDVFQWSYVFSLHSEPLTGKTVATIISRSIVLQSAPFRNAAVPSVLMVGAVSGDLQQLLPAFIIGRRHFLNGCSYAF